MNYQARSLRATLAVMLLVTVAMLGADALGHARVGAEYDYTLFSVVAMSTLAVSASLFVWNVVQYAVKRG